MSANTNPTFPLTPNIGQAKLTGANTARDGTGSNLVTAFTPGTNSSLLRRLHFHAAGTTVAAVITIFLHQGSTYTLVGEVLVTAVTPSNTAVAFSADWTPPVQVQEAMASGATIVCGLTVYNADIHITAFGGDM
jgi:hypothetical protein